jgi:hypothetical protein
VSVVDSAEKANESQSLGQSLFVEFHGQKIALDSQFAQLMVNALKVAYPGGFPIKEHDHTSHSCSHCIHDEADHVEHLIEDPNFAQRVQDKLKQFDRWALGFRGLVHEYILEIGVTATLVVAASEIVEHGVATVAHVPWLALCPVIQGALVCTSKQIQRRWRAFSIAEGRMSLGFLRALGLQSSVAELYSKLFYALKEVEFMNSPYSRKTYEQSMTGTLLEERLHSPPTRWSQFMPFDVSATWFLNQLYSEIPYRPLGQADLIADIDFIFDPTKPVNEKQLKIIFIEETFQRLSRWFRGFLDQDYNEGNITKADYLKLRAHLGILKKYITDYSNGLSSFAQLTDAENPSPEVDLLEARNSFYQLFRVMSLGQMWTEPSHLPTMEKYQKLTQAIERLDQQRPWTKPSWLSQFINACMKRLTSIN